MESDCPRGRAFPRVGAVRSGPPQPEESPMSDLVLLDVRDGVATLTLNRPEKLNAFAADMRERLAEALDRVTADATVRVLVITGAGRAFCAGGDIQHMVGLKSRDASFEEFEPML